jgi:hypothetical protein
MVSDVAFGDDVGGGIPDAVMAEDIPQRLVAILRRVGAPDIVRVQCEAHHAPDFRTFAVERIELIHDHLQKIARITVPGQYGRVVRLAGIGTSMNFWPPRTCR